MDSDIQMRRRQPPAHSQDDKDLDGRKLNKSSLTPDASLPSVSAATGSHTNEPHKSFRIIKSAHLPTLTVALLVLPTGGAAPSPSPAYHTSTLSLILHKPLLPPAFKVYTGTVDLKRRPEESGELVAKFSYPGLCGVKGLKCEGEIIHGSAKGCSRLVIERVGWGREYIVSFQSQLNSHQFANAQFVWKGTSLSDIPDTPSSIPNPAILDLKKDGRSARASSKQSNGGLKLCPITEPGKVLALWENRTDWSILGSLKVYAKVEEGTGLEEIVFSCLGVVAAERVSYRGWIGDGGK